MVHVFIKDQPHDTIDINGETIDNLVNKYNLKPGILVINVEGAENQVLKGSIETLKKYRPTIISELDDNLLKEQNSDSREIIKLLSSLGYNVLDCKGSAPSFPFAGNIIAKFNT
jgi:hypothetical protein